MKKYFNIYLIFLWFFILFSSCNNSAENQPVDDSNNIRFLQSEKGGCNSGSISGNFEIEEETNDTVITNIKNGTLIIDAGLNYVCCAPFTTDCKVSNDSVFIKISDKCPDIYKCYCKCNCYYTFRFSFDNILKKEYFYRIILNDPRVGNEILFKEGVFKNG